MATMPKLVRIVASYRDARGLEIHETLWRGYEDNWQNAVLPHPLTVPLGTRYEVKLIGGAA